MAAQLRLAIYGAPLASFNPGYPSKGEAMRHFIWVLEEEKRLRQIVRLNDTVRRAIKKTFVKNLMTHWSNQPDKKPLLETDQVKKKVQPLIDDWKDLENKKLKVDDQGFIEGEKAKLLPLLDIEAKPKVTKKRSIQEVRNYNSQSYKSLLAFERKFVLRSLVK